MFPPDIQLLAEKAVRLYMAEKRKIVLAESCTGGLIAGALTDIPGSSNILERGFVTYSNDAKTEVLGVLPERIAEYGAVSASDLAVGALEFSLADLCLSVTGIAGPGGGSMLKPVGLVFFGLATRQGTILHYQCNFKGDRQAIRLQSVEEGLKLLLSMTGKGD
jgi:nicotinamide-nucleotide amidase